jgi:hypothetical protein
MTKRAPYREVIEYIALNDEPSMLDPADLVGMPSVQTAAIAYGKTYEQVAADVSKFRAEEREA